MIHTKRFHINLNPMECNGIYFSSLLEGEINSNDLNNNDDETKENSSEIKLERPIVQIIEERGYNRFNYIIEKYSQVYQDNIEGYDTSDSFIDDTENFEEKNINEEKVKDFNDFFIYYKGGLKKEKSKTIQNKKPKKRLLQQKQNKKLKKKKKTLIKFNNKNIKQKNYDYIQEEINKKENINLLEKKNLKKIEELSIINNNLNQNNQNNNNKLNDNNKLNNNNKLNDNNKINNNNKLNDNNKINNNNKLNDNNKINNNNKINDNNKVNDNKKVFNEEISNKELNQEIQKFEESIKKIPALKRFPIELNSSFYNICNIAQKDNLLSITLKKLTNFLPFKTKTLRGRFKKLSSYGSQIEKYQSDIDSLLDKLNFLIKDGKSIEENEVQETIFLIISNKLSLIKIINEKNNLENKIIDEHQETINDYCNKISEKYWSNNNLIDGNKLLQIYSQLKELKKIKKKEINQPNIMITEN